MFQMFWLDGDCFCIVISGVTYTVDLVGCGSGYEEWAVIDSSIDPF